MSFLMIDNNVILIRYIKIREEILCSISSEKCIEWLDDH